MNNRNFLWLCVLCSLFAVLYSCDPDVPTTETCTANNIIRNKYKEDAIRLALRIQQNGSNANQVVVSESLIERMLSALATVENSASPAADSVLTNYSIKTLPYPAYNEFTVEVDTSVVWVHQWMQGQRLTGNTAIDNLMTTYGLDVENFLSLSVNFATLKSAEPLNIAALIDDFEAIDGVLNVDFANIPPNGNDIEAVDLGSIVKLTYTVGYDTPAAPGNCSGACNLSRSWVFDTQIDNGLCQATFVESFGDPAP